MASQKIVMLKDSKDAEGNKLTAGWVYEFDSKFAGELVDKGEAEKIGGSGARRGGERENEMPVTVGGIGHDPREIQRARDPQEQVNSIIADPDMSQNENPFDRPKDKPDPDLSKARSAAVVGERVVDGAQRRTEGPAQMPPDDKDQKKDEQKKEPESKESKKDADKQPEKHKR